MDYDAWKTMTPEEDAGLVTERYRVDIMADTDRRNFERIWDGTEYASDVRKHHWDEDEAFATFTIKDEEFEILTDPHDDDEGKKNALLEAILEWFSSFGDDTLEWNVTKRRRV